MWGFYDDNGDDKADRKEVLFEGLSGEQHDHGVHAFTFGPDGKLYFNCGNEAKQLKDKKGKFETRTVTSTSRNTERVWCSVATRMGTDVECLGQNFRNPYEVA